MSTIGMCQEDCNSLNRQIKTKVDTHVILVFCEGGVSSHIKYIPLLLGSNILVTNDIKQAYTPQIVLLFFY
jgi:hypothetical protein